MGSGSYSRVIFGITDVNTLRPSGIDDDAWDELTVSFYEDYDLVTSYEGASRYLGVAVVSTLDSEQPLYIGVCLLTDITKNLSASLPQKKIATAVKAWDKFRAKMSKRGVTVPNGALIWCDDYD